MPDIRPVGGGAGSGGVNIAASDTTYTSGTVVISGGANVTVGTNGQTVTISAAAGGGANFSGGASNLGNTAGSTGVTGTRLVFVGSNAVSLSQSTDGVGGTLSINVPVQTAQTGISGIANSETTYTSGTVSLSALGNLTIRSTTGNQYQFSVADQSVQAETQTFVGGVGNSQTTYTSGTVNLSVVGGNLTIRSTTGNAFQFSASQSVQAETQTFVGGVAASNTTYTSGTVTITGVGGGVTVNSNTGQRVDISVAAPVAQTNQAGSVYAVGNTTSSSSGTYDARTLSLRGDGIVSVAATNSGWRISASQSVQTQDVLSVGASNVGNTAGDTGVATGSRLVFAGGNNITVSQGTAAGATTITISGANAGGAQTAISGLANSETTYTSGSVTLSGLANITIRSTTGQHYQFSVSDQSAQTGGIYAVGNTTGQSSSSTFDARTLSFRGDGAASVGWSNGSVRISVPTQTVQAETQTFVGGIQNSETTYTSGTVNLSVVGGNLTIRSTTGQAFQFSASQSVQTQDVLSVGASNVGNTAGDTGVATGSRLVFAGGNNITVSQGTAAGATTITISGGAGGAGMSGGLSNIGNTSGDTATVTGRLVLAGGNNITLSGSTNGGSMTVTVSAPNLGAGAMSAGVSTGGNTAGATGITGTQLVLVGSGVVSLSQTTGANGGTVSINAPATSSLSATGLVSLSTNGSTISIGVKPGSATMWFPFNEAVNVAVAPGQGSFIVAPVPTPDRDNGSVYVDRVAFPVNVSNASNSTGSVTLTFLMGLYTKNVSSLSLAHSTSLTTNWTFSGTNSASLHHGIKLFTIPWTTTISNDRYYVGVGFRSTTGGANATVSQIGLSQMNSNFSGPFGAASNRSVQWPLGFGMYSASTTGVPGSIGFSQLDGTASVAARPPTWFMISGTV